MSDFYAYWQLVSIVDKIDTTAAEYLQKDALELESFVASGLLIDCFCWEDTPQGWEYWKGVQQRTGQGYGKRSSLDVLI